MTALPPLQVLKPPLVMIADVCHEGAEMRFLVANPMDLIQRHHAEGRLYEREELALIAQHLSPGGTFIDIGANVGNHAVWALCSAGAGRVIAFEPGLIAHTVLTVNKALNGLDQLDIRKVALSDREGTACLGPAHPANLGGSTLSESGPGQIVETQRGDVALSGIDVDFLKIDVEGHELQVLSGLEGLFARTHPPMMIEVADTSRPVFEDWMRRTGYHLSESNRHYDTSENLILLPAG